jgi:hypothetical protein
MLKLGTVLDPAMAGKLVSGLWTKSAALSIPGYEILKRSDFRCEECGFMSKPSEDVPHGWMVPVDHSHSGMVALNIESGKCLCPLCASVLALNWSVVPKDVKGDSGISPGMLIHMPHMSQVEINRLGLHLISVHASRKLSSMTPFETTAINVNNVFISLNSDLAGRLPIYRHGEDAAFVRALALLPREHYEYREQIIGELRWWPSMDFWRKQGIHWMKNVYAQSA